MVAFWSFVAWHRWKLEQIGCYSNCDRAQKGFSYPQPVTVPLLLRLLKMQESRWIWTSISDIFGILNMNFPHSAVERCMLEVLKGRTWESPGQAHPYTHGVLYKGWAGMPALIPEVFHYEWDDPFLQADFCTQNFICVFVGGSEVEDINTFAN